MSEASELMDIIHDGPYVPVKEVKEGDVIGIVIKSMMEFSEDYRKRIENNYKENKLLVWHRTRCIQ